MKSPHSIRKRSDGFIISDTRNGRIVLLNEDLGLEKYLESEFNWLQDTIEIDKNLFLSADSNNNRLVLIDSSSVVKGIYDIGKGTKKVSTFLIINPATALKILYEE